MRTSATQFEILVDYFERNGDLSKPTEGPQGRITSLNLWAQLASILNSEGSGNSRTAEKWKKVWSDLKSNTKRKAARCFRDAHGTGGGPASKVKLTDLELRVLDIMGPQSATGLVDVAEVGIGQDDQSSNAEIQVVIVEADISEIPSRPNTPEIPMPSTSAPATPPAPLIAQRSPSRRRRMPLTPSHSAKRSRPSTQSELAREQFLKSDAEWRELRKDEEKEKSFLEKERLRLREIELEQQARWQELFSQFLSIMSKVGDKIIEKFLKE